MKKIIPLIVVVAVASYLLGYSRGLNKRTYSLDPASVQSSIKEETDFKNERTVRDPIYSKKNDRNGRELKSPLSKTWSPSFPTYSDNLVDKFVRDLSADDDKDKIRAIDVLASIGTPTLRRTVRNLIFDEDQDVDVKSAAIKALTWDEEPQTLLKIFSASDDPDVMVAVIEAANRNSFAPQTSRAFDNFFLNAYQSTDKADVSIAILDYFEDKPDYLQKIVSLTPSDASIGVLEHISEIENNMSIGEL